MVSSVTNTPPNMHIGNHDFLLKKELSSHFWPEKPVTGLLSRALCLRAHLFIMIYFYITRMLLH